MGDGAMTSFLGSCTQLLQTLVEVGVLSKTAPQWRGGALHSVFHTLKCTGNTGCTSNTPYPYCYALKPSPTGRCRHRGGAPPRAVRGGGVDGG